MGCVLVVSVVREMLERHSGDSAICAEVKEEPHDEELLETGRTENNAESEDDLIEEE